MSEEDKEANSGDESVDSSGDSSKNIDEGSEKLFSQEEVNALVADRVARQKEKYNDYEKIKATLDEKLKELSVALDEKAQVGRKLEISEAKAEVSKKTGVPVDILRGETKEELESHADQLLCVLADSKKVFVPSDGYSADDTATSSRSAFNDMIDKL